MKTREVQQQRRRLQMKPRRRVPFLSLTRDVPPQRRVAPTQQALTHLHHLYPNPVRVGPCLSVSVHPHPHTPALPVTANCTLPTAHWACTRRPSSHQPLFRFPPSVPLHPPAFDPIDLDATVCRLPPAVVCQRQRHHAIVMMPRRRSVRELPRRPDLVFIPPHLVRQHLPGSSWQWAVCSWQCPLCVSPPLR